MRFERGDTPLTITSFQEGLISGTPISASKKRIVEDAVAILNYDSKIFQSVNLHPVNRLCSPLVNWLKGLGDSDLAELPREYDYILRSIQSVLTRNNNASMLWDIGADFSRRVILSIPEASGRNRIWRSIVEQVDSDGSKVEFFDLAKDTYLREQDEGRVGSFGAMEIETLNFWEAHALIKYLNASTQLIHWQINRELANGMPIQDLLTRPEFNRYRTPDLYNVSRIEEVLKASPKVADDLSVRAAAVFLTGAVLLDRSRAATKHKDLPDNMQAEKSEGLSQETEVLNDVLELFGVHSGELRYLQVQVVIRKLSPEAQLPALRLLNRFPGIHSNLQDILRI